MQKAGNIFLVGLMGAGKTTVGKLLAKHLHKTFLDSDHEIERRTGVDISLIFELEGEAGFRSRETNLLQELTQMRDIVLATGGGAVLSKQNREALSQNGAVIYLCASADDLWQRTRHDKSRPLLQTSDPYGKLSTLLDERDVLYREIADITIVSGQQSAHSLARELEQQLSALTQDVDVFYLGRFTVITHAHLCVNSFPIIYQAYFREQEQVAMELEIATLLQVIEDPKLEKVSTPKASEEVTLQNFQGDLQAFLLKDLIPKMIYNLSDPTEYQNAKRHFRTFMGDFGYPEDLEAIIILIETTPKQDLMVLKKLELLVAKVEALQREDYIKLEEIRSQLSKLGLSNPES